MYVTKLILTLALVLLMYVAQAHHLQAFFHTAVTDKNVKVYWVTNNEARTVYCYVYSDRGYEKDFYVPARWWDNQNNQWVLGYSRTYRVPSGNLQYHCE